MTERLRHDAGEVRRMLAARADTLAREVWPGGKRVGREWQVGSVAGEPGRGCAVVVAGAKAGVWADFRTGESGDALDLVAAALFRGDRKDAYRWSLAWLGLSSEAGPDTHRAVPVARDDAADRDDADRRRRAAATIWLAARPMLAGTPAADYLLARGIDLVRLGRQPRALRFHPALHNAESGREWPALVAAITDGDGRYVATHRTWLARHDGVWRKASLDKPKMVLGTMRGGSIRLWRGASGKALRDAPAADEIAIGEGIETCLSVAVECPDLRVLAGVSLTGLGTVSLPEQVRRVLILADNDTKPAARLGLRRAIQSHLAAGRAVRVAHPPHGKDFNDALLWRRQGRAA